MDIRILVYREFLYKHLFRPLAERRNREEARQREL